MQPIGRDKDSTGNRVFNIISPVSLVAIVMLNFLLIYLNLVSLENQSQILQDIRRNQEIGFENQQLALNISSQNREIATGILILEARTNLMLHNLNISESE